MFFAVSLSWISRNKRLMFFPNGSIRKKRLRRRKKQLRKRRKIGVRRKEKLSASVLATRSIWRHRQVRSQVALKQRAIRRSARFVGLWLMLAQRVPPMPILTRWWASGVARRMLALNWSRWRLKRPRVAIWLVAILVLGTMRDTLLIYSPETPIPQH